MLKQLIPPSERRLLMSYKATIMNVPDSRLMVGWVFGDQELFVLF